MSNKQTVARLSVREDLTIYHAAAQKAELLQAIDAAEAVDLDLAQVGQIDTAGVQLLLLAKREAERRGKALSIVAHSDAVREVIDFCNLAAWFGDPVVITARRPA